MSLGFFTWIFFSIFCISWAHLKTHYVDDLCSRWPHKTLWLKKGYSGILASVPSKLDSRECTITLMPEPGSSVVLSVYKFKLSPGDQLTITDYDKIKETLIGEDRFLDEQWSFTSKGAMIVRFSWNITQLDGKRQKFQFIFTHVHDVPCRSDEFECKNKNCISLLLVCDRHNHCGDNSDQENCVFQKEQPKRGKQEEGDDFSGENNINKEYKFNKCRKFIMIAGEHDGKIGGTGPCFHKGKQVGGTSSDDFSGENKINKEYKNNKCRKFIMIGGSHDGKIGGTGPCFYKGPWRQPKTPTHVSCRFDEFQCENRNCIARHYVCDQHNNCGDNSDEKYCYLKFDFGFECSHTMLGLGIAGIAVLISLFDQTFGTDATRSGVLSALSSL